MITIFPLSFIWQIAVSLFLDYSFKTGKGKYGEHVISSGKEST